MMDRKIELLIAAYKLLHKQAETHYATVFYDGAERDGSYLMEDIEAYLYEEGIEIN